MKEYPYPNRLSGPMVRAILDGRKTQTRLVIKLPHNNSLGVWEATTVGGHGVYSEDGEPCPERPAIWHTRTGDTIVGYAVGDRLWVRETWRGADVPGGVEYKADQPCDATGWGWRPSIHMPRWASRITLEITDVRIQRVQDISEDDAIAEGVYLYHPTQEDHEWFKNYCAEHGLPLDDGMAPAWVAPGTRRGYGPLRDEPECGPTAHFAFGLLWDSTNVKRGHSWNVNPWVQAVSFTTVEGK